MRSHRGARVETDGPSALLLLEDRTGNDVARRELGIGMDGEHETLAEIVDEDRSLTPDGLGDKRHRVASDRERRRVELDELHVGQHRPGARGHCDTVSGRFNRIGRISIEPAHSARGEHDRGGREVYEITRRVLSGADTGDAILVDEEILRRHVLDDLDRRMIAHGLDQAC